MGKVIYTFLHTKIIILLQKELNWSPQKAANWYNAPNPYLHRIAPIELVYSGRYLELVEYIRMCAHRGRLQIFANR